MDLTQIRALNYASKTLPDMFNLRLDKAFMQALITLCGFAVPKDLATISLIPKTSQTALTGPPAIIPVPFGADLNFIFPAYAF